jgi:hypothetical protein
MPETDTDWIAVEIGMVTHVVQAHPEADLEAMLHALVRPLVDRIATLERRAEQAEAALVALRMALKRLTTYTGQLMGGDFQSVVLMADLWAALKTPEPSPEDPR